MSFALQPVAENANGARYGVRGDENAIDLQRNITSPIRTSHSLRGIHIDEVRVFRGLRTFKPDLFPNEWLHRKSANGDR